KVFKALTMTFLYGQGEAGHEKLLLEKLPLRNAQFVTEKLEPELKTPDEFYEREELAPPDEQSVVRVIQRHFKREDLSRGRSISWSVSREAPSRRCFPAPLRSKNSFAGLPTHWRRLASRCGGILQPACWQATSTSSPMIGSPCCG